MTKINVIGGQKPNPVGKPRKLYLYAGEHRSAYEIAKMRGEPLSRVVYRLEHGIDLDAAPYETSSKRPARRYEYDGKLMTSAEIAQATGYSISQVLRRTDGVRFFPRGVPTDPFEAKPRIVATPYHQKYELDGVSDTLKGWAKRAGLNYFTLRDRVRLYGVPVALAIKAPVNPTYVRKRNAKVLLKMAQAFSKTADGTASAEETASAAEAASATTGGPSQTLPNGPATGPTSAAGHLLGV